MNALLHWLTAPEWAEVVKALLHTLWQAAMLAVLLGLALRRSVRPATRYYLSLGSLAAVVAVGVLSWALLSRSQPAAQHNSNTTNDRAAFTSQPEEDAGEPAVVVVEAQMTIAPLPPEPSRWMAWLALVWVAGAGLMLVRATIQVAGAERLRRSGRPLEDPRVIQLLAEARSALRLARQVRVAVTDRLTSPAVVGVLVPTLILPLSLLTTLTPEQIRFILLHELAHIRRGDYLANLFQLFAEALLFFNPAVWWISHQVRREREACCDALAIELCRDREPVDYAQTLVRVAENILNPLPAAAPAFGGPNKGPSSLHDRIQRLLVPGYRPALRLTWHAMLTALLLGGSLLVFSAVGTRLTVAAIEQKVEIKSPVPPLPGDQRPDPDDKTLQIAQLKSRPPSATNAAASASTNGMRIIVTSPGRQNIFNKLNSIHLDRFASDNLPLPEVLRKLAEQAKQSDPEQTGVNILIKPASNSPAPGGAPIIDPTTGLPVPSTTGPTEAFDINQVSVNINPVLANVRLEDALDAIVVTASRPIRFVILENAVEFSPKGPDVPQLHTRRSGVGTNFLYSVLKDQTGREEQGSRGEYQRAVLRMFADQGVNLDPMQGRNIFVNDQENTIMVHATSDELDKIEAIIVTSGFMSHTKPAPRSPTEVQLEKIIAESGFVSDINPFPQSPTEGNPSTVESLQKREFLFNFSAFIEQAGLTNADQQQPGQIQQALLKFFSDAGVDMQPPRSIWLSGMLSQKRLMVSATPSELDRIERAVQRLSGSDVPVTRFDLSSTYSTNLTPAHPLDPFPIPRVTVTQPTAKPPEINIKTRFTEVPEKVVEKIRKKWPATQTTSNGVRVVVLSPAQTQEVMKEIRQADKNPLGVWNVTTMDGRQAQIQIVDIKTINLGINPAALTPPGVAQTMETNALFETQEVSIGRVVDFVPSLAPDGRTVRLTVNPRLTEFLGYDKPVDKTTVYVNGTKTKIPEPLPRFRTRQTNVDASVDDGSTLLLEGFTPVETFDRKNGRTRAKEVAADPKRHLLVLVTPSLIDSAGNRIHPDKH